MEYTNSLFIRNYVYVLGASNKSLLAVADDAVGDAQSHASSVDTRTEIQQSQRAMADEHSFDDLVTGDCHGRCTEVDNEHSDSTKLLTVDGNNPEHSERERNDDNIESLVSENDYMQEESNCVLPSMKKVGGNRGIIKSNYLCYQCGTSFTSSQEMKSHVTTNHKPCECRTCGQYFSSFPSLKEHEVTHSDFKCNVCEKHFKSSSFLRNHLRVHMGENTFKCKICDKSFTQEFRFL